MDSMAHPLGAVSAPLGDETLEELTTFSTTAATESGPTETTTINVSEGPNETDSGIGSQDVGPIENVLALEYIHDQAKRTKRFNTYQKRMVDMLCHLGQRCGAFGVLYLRS